MLTLFAALRHGRVYLVLAWTALAPHLQALQLRRLSAECARCEGLGWGRMRYSLAWREVSDSLMLLLAPGVRLMLSHRE